MVCMGDALPAEFPPAPVSGLPQLPQATVIDCIAPIPFTLVPDIHWPVRVIAGRHRSRSPEADRCDGERLPALQDGARDLAGAVDCLGLGVVMSAGAGGTRMLGRASPWVRFHLSFFAWHGIPLPGQLRAYVLLAPLTLSTVLGHVWRTRGLVTAPGGQRGGCR